MPKGYAQSLIKILNTYRSKAVISHKKLPFVKYEEYYRGEKSNQNYNIVQLLVDTKATFILDNNITTSVIAKTINFADRQSVEDMQDMADVLEDAKNEVYKNNKIDQLNKKVVNRGLKTNIGIVEVNWDQDEGELGEVKIDEVNPANFFPDPEASCVKECNYIFTRANNSILTLKKKYPNKIDEINRIASKGSKKDANNNSGSQKRDSGSIITTKTDDSASQLYANENNDGIKNQADSLETWRCFIKDDSIFVEEKKDDNDETKTKKIARLKYPNGRLIVYAGDSLILEDKPIDYPYGYPFSIFYETPGDVVLPKGGTVKNLMYVQDRLSKAYERLRYLLGKFVSLIVIDSASGITKHDVVREDVLELDPESLAKGMAPRVLTNNTINEIESVTKYIGDLKNNAYELARVNPQMVSGERPKGVTSGDMVVALNESALTSIRDLQRNYMDFTIDVTDKVLVLIQKYYNLERYVRISTSEVVKFPLRNEDQGDKQGKIPAGQSIERIKIEKEDDSKKAITKTAKEIKSDPRSYEFKSEIIAGSKLPKSRTQYSQLTMQLVNMGVFGDIGAIDTKRLILDSVDYPNRRAIITEMEAQAKKASEITPVEDTIQLIEKVGLNFKDLEAYPDSQEKLLQAMGLLDVQQETASIDESIDESTEDNLENQILPEAIESEEEAVI